MPTVIISGALANKPYNGGNAWSRLSWVRGFQRLGCDVLFVEQISQSNCFDAAGQPALFEYSTALAYFRDVMKHFGLEKCSSLIFENGEKVHGLSVGELVARAKTANLLFNLSGHLTQPEIRAATRCAAYYDDDPGFTQFWHAAGNDGARLAGHDFYFTIGENIGSADCVIPTGRIQWRHTRPPAVLADWPVCAPQAFDRFTTIASWRGAFGPVTHDSKTYGLKCHEFRKFFTLPQLVKQKFEVALQIHPADQKDLDALLAADWQIIEPKTVANTTDAFRQYVQNSGAEFSPAQGIYVDTNSGWFSDRTVRYLASGRPALVQETGFSRNIKTGEGLLSFRTLAEAVHGAEQIAWDYEAHCTAARRVAEEYFDSGKIVQQLMVEVGLRSS